jgi:hypothetical protein
VVLTFANALLLAALAREYWGRAAALGAALAWLSLPVVLDYGHLVWNLHLAISFLFAALIAFSRATAGERLDRKWATAGCVAISLAVAASWEPAAACPGLLVAAFWNRRGSESRLALAYSAIAAATAALILGNYAIHYPQQVAETVERVLLRMGLSDRHTTTAWFEMSDTYRQPNFAEAVTHIAFQHRVSLRLLGLAAVIWQILSGLEFYRRDRRTESRALVPVVALLSVWWLWTLAFWSHMYIHDCEFLIAAPSVALAIGWGTSLVQEALASRPFDLRHQAAALAGLAMILMPVAQAGLQPRGSDEPTQALVRFGEELRQSVPSGSVVLTPEISAVPAFYSCRHLIGGVRTESDLVRAMGRAPALFPGSSFYLAATPENEAAFGGTAKVAPMLWRTKNLVLFRLDRISAQPLPSALSTFPFE